MLVDLLSMDNYVSYNIKLAEIIGLHPAIYISELLNINEKAVRKDKLNEDAFTVCRDYITKRTTLSKDEQKQIDELLLSVGVLKVSDDNPDSLTLDLTVLTALISAEPVALSKLEDIIKKAAKPKKRTKAEAIVDNLKALIETSNDELKSAYKDWIDAVYAKQGWMSAKSVTVGQKTVDNYANHNLDLALQILEIAAMNAYRDIQWAINAYEKDYKVSYRIPQAPAKPRVTTNLSEEVF